MGKETDISQYTWKKWLNVLWHEFRRFVIYAILVGLVLFSGVLLGETLTTASSIIVFALAVFVISVILPLIGQRLHGALVDTLYYSAAIAATLVIFIANGNELRINEISLEMEDKERALTRAKSRLEQFENAQDRRQNQLPALSAEEREAEAAMAAPWVRALLSIEAELSPTLLEDLGFNRLVEQLPQQLANCSAARDRLSSLNVQAAQLEFEEINSIEYDTWDSGFFRRWDADAQSMGHNLNAEILYVMIQDALDDVQDCNRFQGPAERLLESPDSYARLLGLVAIADLVDPPWLGADSNPEANARLAQIETLEETRRNRDRLVGAVNRLELEIEEAQTELAATRSDLSSRETDLENLAAELDAARSSRPQGMIARAKDWGDRVWPYLLIAMLGMKLARRPMLALK